MALEKRAASVTQPPLKAEIDAAVERLKKGARLVKGDERGIHPVKRRSV
jgi:hypothetical protein